MPAQLDTIKLVFKFNSDSSPLAQPQHGVSSVKGLNVTWYVNEHATLLSNENEAELRRQGTSNPPRFLSPKPSISCERSMPLLVVTIDRSRFNFSQAYSPLTLIGATRATTGTSGSGDMATPMTTRSKTLIFRCSIFLTRSKVMAHSLALLDFPPERRWLRLWPLYLREKNSSAIFR